MERVAERAERFSEVLAVARGPWARHWDEAAARRAFQWARYLERLHARLAGQPALRRALEPKLRERPGQARGPGLPPLGRRPLRFDELGGGVEALRVSLLCNPSASPAAFHQAASCPPRPPPPPSPGGRSSCAGLEAALRTKAAARLLLEAWDSGAERHGSVLETQAELLRERLEAGWPTEEVMEERLLRPSLSGGEGDGGGGGVEVMLEAGGGPEELALRWLLGQGSALLLALPGDLLSRAASRHPRLAAAYLGALARWAETMRYEAGSGRWLHESPERGWGRLVRRLRALLEGPPPVRGAAEELLKSGRAADGDFDVSGISVWTDLLLALKAI
ncbi:Fanconi anemia group F protein [Callorhinchus milii]|uniref:Fanconi anemia group F protein n=1 Tax=Callorhinchus milii TaxID=7868 RepID=UPI001C3F9F1A|nr:Fanconi anemia group F protein [Callorhinchus milii]